MGSEFQEALPIKSVPPNLWTKSCWVEVAWRLHISSCEETGLWPQRRPWELKILRWRCHRSEIRHSHGTFGIWTGGVPVKDGGSSSFSTHFPWIFHDFPSCSIDVPSLSFDFPMGFAQRITRGYPRCFLLEVSAIPVLALLAHGLHPQDSPVHWWIHHSGGFSGSDGTVVIEVYEIGPLLLTVHSMRCRTLQSLCNKRPGRQVLLKKAVLEGIG